MRWAANWAGNLVNKNQAKHQEGGLISPPFFGVGFREPHFTELVNQEHPLDCLEIMTEDFMGDSAFKHSQLAALKERYPLIMHGVSLNIGSADPLNKNYLKRLASLVDRINPLWVSDHLCWTGIEGKNSHDLLPLPWNAAVLTHVVDRVKAVQESLGRQLVLENVSSYIQFKDTDMSEWDFLNALAEQADCFILLDVNNVAINAFNHGYIPEVYIDAICPSRVKQCHLAGFSDRVTHRLDTHDSAISEEVWALYARARKRFPAAATIIERDANIPPLSTLLLECERARAITQSIEGAACLT